LQFSYAHPILQTSAPPQDILTDKVEQENSDIQLLEKVKNSETEAFRILFERYQPVVFRYVLFQIRSRDLSQDIVQETFIRVWENRKSLKPHLSFLAYVLRISGNLVRDDFKYRRTRERLKIEIPAPVLSENDDPGKALQLVMLEEKLNDIINHNLPDRCREIFLLSRFEGKTHQEIADIFGLSVRTVEHQINHALKVIRKKLSNY
jgi:RNA polymerase sigma-70 factor (family 1)